ncbi:MAG: YggT family protein [Propionibacteriaceae bacterium]|nr:YggT family protein [Propionibacteriaceae bacterium]
MALIGVLLHGALVIFLALLTIRAVLGWVPLFVRDWEPQGGLRVVAELVLTLTDPPLRLLGKFLPPIRVGGISFDTAFTVLFVLVLVLVGWI